MAIAYRCDKCKNYFSKFNKRLVYFSNDYDKRFYDICEKCSKVFEHFMKEGLQDER